MGGSRLPSLPLAGPPSACPAWAHCGPVGPTHSCNGPSQAAVGQALGPWAPCPGGPLPPWGGGPGQLWGPGRRQLTSHNEPKTGQMAALTQGVCPEDQAPPSGGPPPQTGPLWGETLWKPGRRLLASQNAGGSFSRRWEALPGHPGDPGDDTGCPASQPPGHTPRGQCRGPTAFTL